MASESVLASRDTLVRYSNPVVVSKHEDKPHSPLGFQEPHGLSAAGPSKPDTAPSPMSEKAKSTEEVLNCILPPREWKENGELWRQTVSSEPATREDVKKLGEQLDTGLQQQQARETGICAVRRRLFGQCFVLNVKDVKKLGEQLDTGLQQQQARETGICAVRRRLFGQCFDEIIRQVTVNCCERGLLLLRVRDEMKMTIAAYQTLYESSIAFGIRKALQAEQGKSDMEETISELKDLKTNLERQVAELRAKAEQVERRATELRQAEEKKHAEEIDFLKKTNQQLKPCVMDLLSLEQEVGAWDSVLLDPLTEDSFISNLHQRFKRDHIYTYIGNVLVSINPYKKLAIYSNSLAKEYRIRGPFQLPPHIFAVAGSAYRWLRDGSQDQCVVVSGESGSGKTEAAKMVLHFITVTSSAEDSIRERLLQSAPLLEAFGNAKTHRNDNSSRFGKYMDIEFDYKGDPLGGSVTNYLLEKSRVTSQAQGERNFHIFYQLLTGADIHLLKCLKLQRNLDNYALLRSSRSLQLDTVDDKRDFVTTRKSLETLGLSLEEVVSVLKVVASVLKLGNLTFLPSSNIDGTEACTISNDYELYEICLLLETDMGSLCRGLTQRTVTVFPAYCPSPGRRSPSLARELYEVCDLLETEPSSLQTAVTSRTLQVSDSCEPPLVTELSASEATHVRDALCKALYSRLFTWLVNRINESIKVRRYGKRRVLGILDVYGFEMLEKNGFEQFVINFCNEKLHQVITEATLKQEQEDYLKEDITWTPVDYFNNSSVCHIIEKNNHGILSILDEESSKTNVSDEVFLTRVMSLCGHSHSTPDRRNRHTPTSDNSLPPNCFRLRHFAGTVTYNVTGFIEKNNDFLPRDISMAMYRCQHPLLKILFPEGNPKRGCVKRPVTAGAQFKIAIQGLVRNLTTKQPHYVRCIKPNELKQPRIFEMALVQHQVKYLGLLETVRVRRCGFCFRLTYPQFLARYKLLSLHTWPCWLGTPVEGVSYLLRDLPIPAAEFAFGRTKIFVRSPRSVFELEEFRRERLEDLATLIQKIWRGHNQRKDFLRRRRAQIIIAAAWRSWRELRFGIPFQGQRHLWCLYRVAREEYRILKRRKQIEWAVGVIQRLFTRWKRKQLLLRLSQQLTPETDSPVCRDWPPCSPRLLEANMLLCRLHHRWRCHKYRLRFDQTARNRMREKVTASIIFKERKASYPRSVGHPFLGDYVRLRQNVQWKKICVENNDQYVVFADIINKITRSSGKFVPILFVLSTSAMLILDQRTLQVKYRVPATEIYRLSLSPYLDDVAVFHVKAPCALSDCSSDPGLPLPTPGCLFQSELARKKGDFVFQTGHVIEIVTKLFLVVQNAVGKPPQVNISTEFEANFGQQTVAVVFKCMGLPEVQPGQIRVLRKANKMEILV